MNGLASFNRDLDFSNMNVLVVGAGGSSRAVIYSFDEINWSDAQ